MENARKCCVKVYLCSDLEDSEAEREALRETVFPRVREHLRRIHGVEFRAVSISEGEVNGPPQVIDPCEGAEHQSPPDLRTRLRLLEECRKSSAGPFFVALVGERHSSACPPVQVEVSEFQTLLWTCEHMGLNTRLLERRYRRDENAIPPSFVLQDRPHHSTAGQMDDMPEDADGPQQEISATFQAAVARCVQEGRFTSEKAHKYFSSALEKEVRFALEDHPLEDGSRALCYIRELSAVKSQEWRVLDPDPMTSLREHLLLGLMAPGQLLVRTSSANNRGHYIDSLCQQLYADLLNLIDRTLVQEESCPRNALSQDLLHNLELCHIYSGMYRIECPETEHIKAYFERGDTGHPLVISGGACTGKTVLLSHCALQVTTWLDGRSPVVVARFAGSNKVTLQELLRSVCYQIAVNYGEHPWLHTSHDLIQLSQDFRSLLITASTSRHPLILIFDGLDQMEPEEDKSLGLWWLPKSLPANIKLLISTTPKKSGTLRALRALYPKSLFLELGSKDRRDLNQMLVDLLLAHDRRITSGQHVYVNRALASCPLPLCVELLCKQVCEWRSDSEVMESSLTSGVHNNITLFFSQLEKKHSRELVSRALCYLTLARQGLTEAELTDALSSDNSVLSHFVPGGQVLSYKLRLPEVVVEMLLLDLERFLMRRHVAGSEVLFWSCRHFPLVIQKLYLCSAEATREMHATLADVFSGCWANGRTKSLIACRRERSKPQDVVPDTIPVKIYTDRLHPDQPWIFDATPSMTLKHANLRKILELPFHLKSSGRLEELGRTAMSLGFHQAMLQAGHLEELVSQLEEISVFMFRQELRLLARILRDSSCLLRGSPENLPVVMQAELFPFLNALPSLESYAKQISEEGMKSNRLAVVQSSVAAVPSASWMLSDVDRVPLAEVLELQCNTVVIILQNCSIWAWNEDIPGNFKLIHSFSLSFSSAKSTQHFFLLSTQCPRLFLCDIRTPLCVLEVDVRSSMPDGSVEPSSRPPVEGFLVLESKVFVSYKETRYIGVFNVNTGEGLPPLLCPSNVSCVSGCPSGQLILCGQDDGMVSVFAVQDNCHLVTCSIPAGRPVIEILHESEGSFVCVDSTGSIYVWDTETMADLRLTKACLTEGEEQVLSTEHSQEDGVFVVCKSRQIFLLDTCEWTVEEQFSAPAGRKFTQAVLAKMRSLIIASLEGCLFLLVWKRTTGQCILNLDTGHTQCLRLLKLESTLLALTENRILTAWDLDLVFNVSLLSRCDASVKKIFLESAGGHFYTMDGTESVWRWETQSGRVQGVFQHESPVETVALTADDKHLVTATLTDICVWQTATGQNVQRICSNSLVSYLLVTPNNNFAVSLCERGLSRVWKLSSGHIVCNIHLYLRNAIISPESTYVLGLHEQDLLAVSLWSGCVSKRFSCSTQMDVVAFQPLLGHVDYVAVITSSGCLFTWRITEETICQHVQIPSTFLSQPDMIQFSSDGRYAILSTADNTISVLDTQNGRLCLLPAEGKVLMMSLDVAGRYVVFVCESKPSDCTCHLHSGPVLSAASVSDGKSVGRLPLGAVPSALSLSEELCAHVGYKDGSVAVYAICAAPVVRGCLRELGHDTPRAHEKPLLWSPLTRATVTWVNSASVL